jgi:hypothetical protein
MTDPNEAFFSRLQNRSAQQRHDAEEQRQAHYESEIIKKLLKRGGLQGMRWSQWMRECHLQTGSEELCFRWFHDAFPQFPARLGAEKLAYVHTIPLKDFFKRFSKTRIFTAYEKFLAESDLDDTKDAVAFIFSLPDLGTMVLHNLPRLAEIGAGAVDGELDHGVSIVCRFGRPVVTYVIEEFSRFLDAVGMEWLIFDD